MIHGFNVRDGGENTIDRLAPYLEGAGHHVDRDGADYGYYSLLKVRLNKHSAVLRIAEALENADVVISHSNGANYAYKALKLFDHRPQRFIEIRLSPALNRGTDAAKSVDKCFVYHTRTDMAVRLSSYLPWHPWGRQGAFGYKGDDPRMQNLDRSDIIRKHSDWFKGKNTRWIAREILELIE